MPMEAVSVPFLLVFTFMDPKGVPMLTFLWSPWSSSVTWQPESKRQARGAATAAKVVSERREWVMNPPARVGRKGARSFGIGHEDPPEPAFWFHGFAVMRLGRSVDLRVH